MHGFSVPNSHKGALLCKGFKKPMRFAFRKDVDCQSSLLPVTVVRLMLEMVATCRAVGQETSRSAMGQMGAVAIQVKQGEGALIRWVNCLSVRKQLGGSIQPVCLGVVGAGCV